jgi:hypothetical protein
MQEGVEKVGRSRLGRYVMLPKVPIVVCLMVW